MNTRRALITGAAGFIGRNLTQFLRHNGWSVRPLDNLSIPPLGKVPLGLWRADVLDIQPADLANIDVIIHLAANKSVPRSFASHDDSIKNIQQDRHLLEVASCAGVSKVILASSCEVYGRQEHVPRLIEHAQYNPMSPYAVSKVALELHANIYRQLTPDTVFTCVRLFNTYGPDEGRDAVVPRFIDDIFRYGCLTIEGDGSQRRDFSFIDDIVCIIGDLLLLDFLPPVINIGSGEEHSVFEIASIITSMVGAGTVKYIHGRPNEIQSFRADTRLLEKLIDKRINCVSLNEGIKRCIDEYKDIKVEALAGRVSGCTNTINFDNRRIYEIAGYPGDIVEEITVT